MTLNISISPHAEEVLRERAAAAGKDPAQFLSDIVERELVEEAAPYAPRPARTVYETVAPYLERARQLKRVSGTPLRGLEAEFAEGVAEKLRKQGLKA